VLGYYLHSELYGGSQEMGTDWAHRSDMIQKMKEERAKKPDL